MRVLWITGNFQPEIGGLQVYTERLTDCLSRGNEVGLVTGERHTRPNNAEIVHFSVANITAPRDQEAWQYAQENIASIISEFVPDVVHLANANVAVYRPVIGRSVPVVASVHGNDMTAPWQRVPGQNVTSCIREGLNECDRIIAVSRHTAGLVVDAGVTAPLTVLRSGCDLDFFSPAWNGTEVGRDRYGIPRTIPILLTVGRLVPRKGHFIILKALRILSFPVCWLVVGDGPLRERLVGAITESELSGPACLTGEVSMEELRSLYQECDVFVLPPEEQRNGHRLDSEGFGLVFLEAGACCKPVIGSDISGCREAVIHGRTGLLVPPGDPYALADAIQRVILDQDLAASLAMGGLASVRAGGGWPRLARQMEEIYEDLVVDTRSEQDLIRLYRV
jgi:phosphatidylinositol alpha-1,6-mannosyltransferase